MIKEIIINYLVIYVTFVLIHYPLYSYKSDY